MTTLTNYAFNSSFEDWTTSPWQLNSVTVSVTGSFPQMIQDGSKMIQIVADGTHATPGISLVSSLYRTPIKAGQWIGFKAFTATENFNYQTRLQVGWRDGAGASTSYQATAFKAAPFYAGDTPELVLQAPANTESAALYLQYRDGNNIGVLMPAGKRMWVDAIRSYVGDTEQQVRDWLAEPFFDGDDPADSKYIYGYTGAFNSSPSYRIDRLDLLHGWTRKLWGSLPNAYRMADAVQDPGEGYFPLLRWLNGVGALAGEMRDLSDAVWNNELTDLSKAPDAALRWLAQLLGLSESQRAVSLTDLRAALVEITAGGRPAIGTRRSIAEATKRFLTGEKQVTVLPSSITPHTIVLLVRAAEVPGGNLVTLANNVRATGVIPAGHNVIAQNAVATWDSFMAAAGVSWNEKDQKAVTWAKHDTLGVVLEA
ncbi:tail protein [Arthrobacter phage Jawnski]|uniref:Tail protein n=1 Tax=Arthrobacter phage Jawnski TaxID=1772327 RepID=A0A0U4B3P4_9CAUD|nr:tail protein [Arthrobacter phage Jawnski]ALY09360.1 tail protein [Arthrobacter phage Jawnski]